MFNIYIVIMHKTYVVVKEATYGQIPLKYIISHCLLYIITCFLRPISGDPAAATAGLDLHSRLHRLWGECPYSGAIQSQSLIRINGGAFSDVLISTKIDLP